MQIDRLLRYQIGAGIIGQYWPTPVEFRCEYFNTLYNAFPLCSTQTKAFRKALVARSYPDAIWESNWSFPLRIMT